MSVTIHRGSMTSQGRFDTCLSSYTEAITFTVAVYITHHVVSHILLQCKSVHTTVTISLIASVSGDGVQWLNLNGEHLIQESNNN